MSESTITRPVLRWHGGKFRLGQWVISHLPEHRMYCEPYGGAASVLMLKRRAHVEVYNDLDGEVVNLFRVLRDRTMAGELERLLRLTPFAREEFRSSYLPTDDPIERARRLVVRSFMGFGTTSRRKNMTGFRSKPYRDGDQSAMNDWANYPDALPAMVARLQGVLIECEPAITVIRRQDTSETLFYVDPPYPLSTRTSVQWPSRNDRAYAHDMTDDDHRELAVVLRSVEGLVVLSGYPCDLYDLELYPDWPRVPRKAMADGAKERTEVLWLSPRTWERLNQPRLL